MRLKYNIRTGRFRLKERFLEYDDIDSLKRSFLRLGCHTIAVKVLSRQDDSKHQIYLSTTAPLTQLFPGELSVRGASASESKHLSSPGAPIFALKMDFTWVQADGTESFAPNASIIEYPQYPEVRFSGFLAGSTRAPSCLSGPDQAKFGERALVFGIAGDKVYGTVLTSLGSPKAIAQLGDLLPWEMASTCLFVPLDKNPMQMNRQSLLREMSQLASIPHKPMVLKLGDDEPKEAKWQAQSAGWTLEALLGIPRNSAPGPDKLGFEIKSVGSSRTSLITTEPDFGLRFDLGLKEYLIKHGHPAKDGTAKLVFNGAHRCREVNEASGAVLEIIGWNSESNLPVVGQEISVVLRDVNSRAVLAGWSLAKLASHWVKKHSAALYVESKKTGAVGNESITFGPKVLIGEGTGITMLLTMISSGVVFLDPGDSLSGGKTKARTQWRVNGSMNSNLPERLQHLYKRFDNLDLANL